MSNASHFTLPEPGEIVSLRKLRPSDSPMTQTSAWRDWKMGQKNPLSPPTGYELAGELLEKLCLDGQIAILRFERNGIQKLGMYRSTRIIRIEGSLIYTANSVYAIRRDCKSTKGAADRAES